MKRHTYSVKFKDNQANIATALTNFGSLFTGWGRIVSKHAALGGAIDDVMTLDSSGKILNVSRRMTDSCYTELRAVFSDDSLHSISQAHSSVDSIQAPPYFVDI